MPKLDGLKEELGSLRTMLTIFVAISVALVGALVNNARHDIVDIYFYVGVFLLIVFGISILFVSKRIIKITKEIKEM